MEDFLIRFKRMIDQLEQEFSVNLRNTQEMNQMLITYEEGLIENFGDGYKKSKVNINRTTAGIDHDDHYMIFD